MNLYSQDTTSYSQGTLSQNDKQYDKLLKYFIADRNEVRHLWKLNLYGSLLLEPTISYENRLGNKWSVILGLDLYRLNPTVYDQYGVKLLTNLRYYHNIEKRDFKGKNTNGFSANYFAFGINTYLNNFQQINYNNEAELIYSFGDIGIPTSGILPTINFAYGIQRRIGNIGYVDISTGLGFGRTFGTGSPQNYIIIPGIKFELGFAIKSLRIKK